MNMKPQTQNTNKDTMKALAVMGIFILALVIYTSWVSAVDYTPHKQNTDLQFSITSNNATQCNVTTLDKPSGVSLLNMIMTKNGQTFNTTILSGNLTALGVHCFNIMCTDGLNYEPGNICKDITYTGETFSIERVYIYILGLIFLVLFALGLVFIISKLPASDVRSDDGAILQVSMMKHLRPVLWIGVWGIGLACIFIISNLGIAYLNDAMMGDLFFKIFQVMFWFTIIGVPVYFIFIFYKIFADKETQKLIERGVEIRTP